MSDSIYEYSDFKVDRPKVDDGWYLVKDGITYRVEVPMNKMRFTKSVNILTGEVHYPSNADRIRSMSDEELADELLELFACFMEVEWSRDMILDWLKEEAER